jgi:hypothetical protein
VDEREVTDRDVEAISLKNLSSYVITESKSNGLQDVTLARMVVRAGRIVVRGGKAMVDRTQGITGKPTAFLALGVLVSCSSSLTDKTELTNQSYAWFNRGTAQPAPGGCEKPEPRPEVATELLGGITIFVVDTAFR